MYDLSKVDESPNILNRENILANITSYEIFSYYYGDKLPENKCICSPLRNDENPSFSFYSSKTGVLRYRDHALGQGGDCFDFVIEMFGETFYQALIRINKDFNLNLDYCLEKASGGYRPTNGTAYKGNIQKKDTVIQIKKREWAVEDKRYWYDQYGIGGNILKMYNAIPVEVAFVNGVPVARHSKKSPMYAYRFCKDNKVTYKIYRPYEPKERKWISNTDKSVLQGWDQLPLKGDFLVITKSLKDVMTLKTFRVPSLAMQNEMSTIKESVMLELKKRFKHIIILQDFDYAGVKGTNKLRKLYDLEYTFLQTFATRSNGAKDISDHRKKFGWQATAECIIKYYNFYKHIYYEDKQFA